MSHPCSSDPRPTWPVDYTETMKSETLMQIRRELMKGTAQYMPGSWEAKRLDRINQVLRKRGFKNLHL
jgi:hypothetical protein